MPRSSQTDLAVLGALSIEPMTGYQLRAAIREVLGHFWTESFGQIYPALARLEAAGQVRRRSPGKTSGSLFELTAAGRTALRQGLTQAPEAVPPPRNGVLLRLFFGDSLGSEHCRQLLGQAAEDARTALSTYSRIRTEIDQEASAPGRRYRLMTLSAGEHSARATLAWALECLASLDET